MRLIFFTRVKTVLYLRMTIVQSILVKKLPLTSHFIPRLLFNVGKTTALLDCAQFMTHRIEKCFGIKCPSNTLIEQFFILYIPTVKNE